ncbi:MAG: histidinol-phosphate transaminase [Thermodesulfovibrionales bacterium]|nr:histidinol-phosphate transaminase [Thermodesulfovibrionales bacterium]
MDIKRLVKPCVRKLRAYQAEEPSGVRVKLDANESPYGFSLARGAIASNRYPDPEGTGVRRMLARQLRVPKARIMLGNGSDELIYYLVTTFGGPVLYPTPTFVMYGHIARALGERALGVPLGDDFDLDANAMFRALKKERPKLTFLATPNNPTGNCLSAGAVLKIIEASRAIVVVDEAYMPFASQRGFAPLLADYPNLIIMRTLSKVGLAALRLGYMVASEEIIEEVNKVRLPFNVNAYSQAHAQEALADRKGARQYIQAVVRERRRLIKELEKFPALEVYPSEANFILFRVRKGGAGAVHAKLLKRGVLVRNLDGAVKGALRVSVGKDRENTAFLKAMKEIFNEKGPTWSKGKKKSKGPKKH